jgi:hypothetical protein
MYVTFVGFTAHNYSKISRLCFGYISRLRREKIPVNVATNLQFSLYIRPDKLEARKKILNLVLVTRELKIRARQIVVEEG